MKYESSDPYTWPASMRQSLDAATIRRAAALMCERAEAATSGPWVADQGASGGWWVEAPNTATIADIDVDYSGHPEADAEHIASMHPAVALAMAAVLTALADRAEQIIDATPTVEFGERIARVSLPGYADALTLARTYLGEVPA